MTRPLPNLLATADLVVFPADLASALPLERGDEFPAVLATSRMIALMEIAAARVLTPQLESEEVSVGVGVDIRHFVPTPPGARVTATARYVGKESGLHLFEVTASDDGGEIGRGWHRRAIVNTSRLERGAARRVPQAEEVMAVA